jgi:hypothetical protein
MTDDSETFAMMEHARLAQHRALFADPGFDVGAAVAGALNGTALEPWIRAGDARLLVVHTGGEPLPSDWGFPINEDEIVLAHVRLPPDTRPGRAALVVRASALPIPELDDEEQERIALALAEALLKEVP